MDHSLFTQLLKDSVVVSVIMNKVVVNIWVQVVV